MNITLDGYLSGSQCELDWHFKYWNEAMAISLKEQLEEADTIIMGRVTFNAMAAYWKNRIQDVCVPREDLAIADMLNSHTKIVFSKTLVHADEWNNSIIIKDNLRTSITCLKKQPGKKLIVYGSHTIVTELVRLNLVDEFRLWVHPVVIGKGKALFKNINETIYLQLYKSKVFSTGVVLLFYSR